MAQTSDKTHQVIGPSTDRVSAGPGCLAWLARGWVWSTKSGRWLLLLVALMMWSPSLAAQDTLRLYVYLPSYIRPYVVQKRLQSECPDIAITVFGHHREFGKSITNSMPHAILSLAPVVEQAKYGMYEPLMYATRSGDRDEELVLLSVGERVSRDRYAEIAIGVVDILGRSRMKNMLGEILDIEEPNIKPVSRLEDLLALLQVNEADAIIVSREMEETYFRQRSKLKLETTELDEAKMGLAVLSCREDVPESQRKQLVTSIKNVSRELFERLGVEQWELP